MKSQSPFGFPLALPFGLLGLLVVVSLITTANKKVNKIEIVPASRSVTQAAPSGDVSESATTTTVEVASSPDKTGEVRRINFTVLPRLGNGTNR